MTSQIPDEGRFAADLIYGRGERPRAGAPEPSLLPHLAARLAHDFSVEKVLAAARLYGCEGCDAPPWYPLWEATFHAVAARAEFVEFLRVHTDVDATWLRVVRTLHSGDQAEAQDLFRDLLDTPVALDASLPLMAAPARLAPLLSRDVIEHVLNEPEFDPAGLDAESARSLLAAVNACGASVSDDWVERAIEGERAFDFGHSRVAHLLPELPEAQRTPRADVVAEWYGRHHFAPYMRALVVSRVGPYVSSRSVWPLDDLLDDLDGVWRAHIETLLDAPASAAPWGDVMRAHPEYRAIARVQRPHETTADAPDDIRHTYAGPEDAAAGPDTGGTRGGPTTNGGGTRGGPPDDDGGTRGGLDEDAGPAAPEPMASRRLQGTVLHDATMNEVDAFVAGAEHTIDVSIGRGARIRANADFDETVFDDTDQDWIKLPVAFRANGQSESGELRVPRNQARNSTVVSFPFTAPDSGRVVGRIHVFRPGGRLLLQSATFVGDVVATVDAARGHANPFSLDVDVVAGDLADPPPGGEGAALIADPSGAVTERDGKLVEINVARIASRLADNVHEIETAADRQDLDPAAIEDTLKKLALTGQEMYTGLKRQLSHVIDANPLQIVSLLDGDILPLELMYDGPPLSSASRMCETWQEALRAGHCKGCKDGGPDTDARPARVCPLRFWSMQKVIERRAADARGGAYRVGAERSAGRPRLRAFAGAVVGASSRVAANDVDELSQFATATLSVPSEVAADWDGWRRVIQDRHPELLVAMPHNHALDGNATTALMMGEPAEEDAEPPPATELLVGAVARDLVQIGDDAPGPIVFLLGCNTQFEEGRLASFAGAFRDNGAALTVGTLGKLRADHAPRAARVLLERMITRRGEAQSVGEAMLAARRELLADGMIMALLLVANGDALWLLPEAAEA